MLFRKIGDKNTGYSNLIHIRNALTEYLEKYDGVYPPAESWCDHLLKVDSKLSKADFVIPKIEEHECNFAYNKNLEGLNTTDVPEDLVVVFMSEGDWNLSGGEELLKELNTVSTYVLLGDGTIRRCRFPAREILRYNTNTKEGSLVQLQWTPLSTKGDPNETKCDDKNEVLREKA
jgi:hypothetical protein